MFTGIIQFVGTVVDVAQATHGRILRIDASGWDYTPAAGASVCVSGCCLSAVADPDETTPGVIRFDVIPETLDRTMLGGLRSGDGVNLEHAVTPASLFDGHLVQGHVDGVATITDVDRADGEWRIVVSPPPSLLGCIVEKGSVALDGVSLTVARLDGPRFDVALIPTTLEATTLGRATPGGQLNIEADYVAKTIVHWLERSGAAVGRLATDASAS
jgi:riboflavin synthase